MQVDWHMGFWQIQAQTKSCWVSADAHSQTLQHTRFVICFVWHIPNHFQAASFTRSASAQEAQEDSQLCFPTDNQTRQLSGPKRSCFSGRVGSGEQRQGLVGLERAVQASRTPNCTQREDTTSTRTQTSCRSDSVNVGTVGRRG
eukprot:4150631-Amphidinium_carterae.1